MKLSCQIFRFLILIFAQKQLYFETLYVSWITSFNVVKPKEIEQKTEKGLLQYFKGILNTFLEHFIYSIFKNINEKFDTKKTKDGRGGFGECKKKKKRGVGAFSSPL